MPEEAAASVSKELSGLPEDGLEDGATALAKRTIFQVVNTETQEDVLVDREDSGVRLRHVMEDKKGSQESSQAGEKECWLHFSDSTATIGTDELKVVFRDISGELLLIFCANRKNKLRLVS